MFSMGTLRKFVTTEKFAPMGMFPIGVRVMGQIQIWVIFRVRTRDRGRGRC